MRSSGNSPNANGSTGSDGRRRTLPPEDLTVDTLNTSSSQSAGEVIASTLSSARLTPSPYRARLSTILPDLGAGERPGMAGAETKNPFGHFRQYPQKWINQAAITNDSDLDSGVGLRQTEVPSAWDAPETYLAFVQGAPVNPRLDGFANRSPNDGGSSFASSSSFNPAFACSTNSFNYAYQRNASQTHPRIGSSFASAPPLSSNGKSLNFSPNCFVRQSLAAEVQKRDGFQLLGHGHSRCASNNVHAHHEGVFGTRQLREALTPANNPPFAAEKARGSQSQSSGFQPMMVVSQPERLRNDLATMQLQSTDPTKFSSRYHGMHTESNASIDSLPNDLNCALWLTNLPADINYPELLHCIRNIGRVYCTYINYPDGIRHQTAAAKVVFFTPAAAQKLLAESWTKTLVVREHRVRASFNRIRTQETCLLGNKSRVLIITGSADFVNLDTLRVWFGKRFQFHEDKFFELINAGDRVVWEFRFGSYRCQSQMGKMSLEKDRPAGFEKVEFGEDPCEVGETMASYSIAAERIQGKGLY